LRILSLADKEPPYREMCRRLAKHPSDIYYIHPFRLEQVVRDVLTMSMNVEFAMTVHSKDGGYDLIGFDAEGEKVLVEVKRYRHDRKIGVRSVRHLAGVLVRENAEKGVIVTTSDFTRDSASETGRLRSECQDYPIAIDLLKFADLLPWLEVVPLASNALLNCDEYWNGKLESFQGCWISL